MAVVPRTLRGLLPGGRMLVAPFFLMCGYGMVRPLSNSLFTEYLGAARIPWALAAVPLVVTLVMAAYSRLLTATGPRRTLRYTTLASALLLLAPILAGGAPGAGLLYVWREVYVVLLVEQYWAYANSSHEVAGGKKVYGPFLLAGGLGALAGNGLVVLGVGVLGSWPMAALAVLTLVPFARLMDGVHRDRPVVPRGGSEPAPGAGGLGLLLRQRTLFCLGLMVALGQVLGAAMDVSFHVHLQAAVPDLDLRSAREAGFWASVNAASLALNLAAPLVLARVSLPLLHLLVPLVHLGLCATALGAPGAGTAGLALAAFKVLDYSLFRCAKELLYIPLSFDARFRSKMLIDMVIYRVFRGAGGLALGAAGLAGAALPALAAGCALA
ncbi:MAG: hypothetical protein FJ098_14370, partial [Deltaproteobacteria bacterium]|nr:hypothetical protein [Deltaproteobacteria bacterium]